MKKIKEKIIARWAYDGPDGEPVLCCPVYGRDREETNSNMLNSLLEAAHHDKIYCWPMSLIETGEWAIAVLSKSGFSRITEYYATQEAAIRSLYGDYYIYKIDVSTAFVILNKIVKCWAYKDKDGKEVICSTVHGDNEIERLRNQFDSITMALVDSGNKFAINGSKKNHKHIDIEVQRPDGRVLRRYKNVAVNEKSINQLAEAELIKVDTINGQLIINQSGPDGNYVSANGNQYKIKAGTTDELEELDTGKQQEIKKGMKQHVLKKNK